MLTPVDVWFDEMSGQLPESVRFKLDLLRRACQELRKLDVEFQPLPTPTLANMNYALGKIRHDVKGAFSKSGCENWSRMAIRRIGSLQQALKAEGVV